MKFHSSFVLRTPAFGVDQNISEVHFDESIYIASPDLYYESKKNQENINKAKLDLTLSKYRLRSCFRSTPFGLFSSIAVGNWGDSNQLELNRGEFAKKCQLDMNLVFRIIESLLKVRSLRNKLLFYPNNSIYHIEESIRYVEYSYNSNNNRIHRITKVHKNEYLNMILDSAAGGATIEKLALELISDEVTEEESREFLDELVNSQLLTSELDPKLTGGDPLTQIIERIHQIILDKPDNELIDVHNILRLAKEGLMKIETEKNDQFDPSKTYKVVYEQLKKLVPDLSETNVVKVDLYKIKGSLQLNQELQPEIYSSLVFLNKIMNNHENRLLADFKQKFHERFEDREIALTYALDSETGIGYPVNGGIGVNKLIEDIHFYPEQEDYAVKLDPTTRVLLTLLTKSIKDGERIIKVEDQDFQGIDNTGKLPPSMGLIFKLLNKSGKVEIVNLSGGSAANLLGRFGGGDEELASIIRDVAEHERLCHSKSILAEIMHIPESRTANVLFRPNFRGFEIPYLGTSSLSKDYQIEINDLFLSVRNNRLFLRSKKHNCEVVPKLSNAHNFSHNSLPVYHFLCDLQNQDYDKINLNFNWGWLISVFEFFPRVEYKNTVLSLAKWILRPGSIEKLAKERPTGELINHIIDKYNLPRLVVIQEMDNELLVDLETTSGKALLMEYLKKYKSAELILTEFPFDSAEPAVTDNTGVGYTNQFIGVWLNEQYYYGNAPDFGSKGAAETQDVFFIGDKWLYFKLYCGTETTDFVLNKITQFITSLKSSKLINKWFFIRYADPDHHIRLRIEITHPKHYSAVCNAFNLCFKPVLKSGVIHRIATDTYRRELGRYGTHTIEETEYFFFADSECVCNAINYIKEVGDDNLRWQFAILSCASIINNLITEPDDQIKFLELLSNGFFQEQGGSKQLKTQLDGKFRISRSKIHANFSGQESAQVNQMLGYILERERKVEVFYSGIKTRVAESAMEIPLNDYVGSLIHMNLNRIFSSKARLNETVVYGLLYRYKKSEQAKQKKVEAEI